MNLKARTKGKLADGKPIGGIGRLSDTRIKKFQKDYGLAIRQNTIRKSNPGRREVEVAVYGMKKNIIAILHHNVESKTQPNSIDFVHQGNPPGVNGSKTKQQEYLHTVVVTVCQRSFLMS